MKNIHVLPTEKPSELYINMQGILSKSNSLLLRLKSRHIYITNSEEIKEGDWFTDDNNSLKRSYKLSHVQFANPKKIILTTDDLLIKDGVQAIDDEFLEWFVKNPSCEMVDVVKEDYGICNSKDDKCYCYTQIDEHNCPNFIKEYKIIVPKEEPKQETTLEEVAERIRKELVYAPVGIIPNFNDGFELGAKWQQQQDKNKYSDEKEFYKYMAKQDSWKSVGLIIQEFIQLKLKEQDKKLYSEEEVISLLIKREYVLDLYDMANDYEDTVKWFEQFKKK
jgi:hypothetical protein